MSHPPPHPSDRPVRVLFVFAWLAGGPEEGLLRLLSQTLDPARFRIDALPCRLQDATLDPTHERLAALGITVDRAAYEMGFDDTVRYLERKIAGYEIVVSCQDVADIYPAMERLRHHPPLIEYGRSVVEAMAGPKHLTTRYVAATEAARAAAADRMPDRPEAAMLIPPPPGFVPPRWLQTVRGNLGQPPVPPEQDAIARQWEALFDAVLAQTSAPPPGLFQSFLQGGFECSTQRLRSGRRVDVIAATRHDIHAESDYRQLQGFGMRTVRDGLRWHLIDQTPGRHDFASFLPMAKAALRAGTEVIWDLMHYGWPDDLEIWSPAFVDRFAAFARAAARVWRDETDAVPFWCPVNEISFFSWGGGDVGYLNPFAHGRGFELKLQLARASIAAMHALREVDPRARFVHCEPLIAIHHSAATGRPRHEAEGWHQAQFQALELLSGRLHPEIGGDPTFVDIVGANYYPTNQWIHGSHPIDIDHPLYRPLSDLLFELHARYRRPIFIAETGVEDDRRAPWFRYVAAEVARARQRGVPVEGLCLYPILNHPGWDDDRDCHNGLMTQGFVGDGRGVDPALAEAVAGFALHGQDAR
ncbi:MAG: hypothetical protein B7Z10_00905 [Rhodobacterales bacterium 32-66-7]|nr:MAG: hypothetical protein B7Z10_00905 [Rhodobacterales bacterium 32-66-7]